MATSEDIGIGDMQLALSNVKEGNPQPERVKKMLALFCERAKELRYPSSPFPDPLTELLIYAFNRYLNGEEPDIAKALGLKGGVGRPPTAETEKRNAKIVAEVLRLNFAGIPLEPNRNCLESAFSQVGKKFGLSETQTRDVYYVPLHQSDGLALLLIERLEGATQASG